MDVQNAETITREENKFVAHAFKLPFFVDLVLVSSLEAGVRYPGENGHSTFCNYSPVDKNASEIIMVLEDLIKEFPGTEESVIRGSLAEEYGHLENYSNGLLMIPPDIEFSLIDQFKAVHNAANKGFGLDMRYLYKRHMLRDLHTIYSMTNMDKLKAVDFLQYLASVAALSPDPILEYTTMKILLASPSRIKDKIIPVFSDLTAPQTYDEGSLKEIIDPIIRA